MRPKVMATPLTSGGKVSVTSAMRRFEERLVNDSTMMFSVFFTLSRLPALCLRPVTV